MSEQQPAGSGLLAPARLDALARTMLLDSPAEEAFDRYTRLLSRIVGAPVALLSLVDDTRQFFKSAVGLGEPWASARGTGLSRSFCQHVVADDAVLRVTDARTDPRVSANDAIVDLGVIAYLGAPVHGPDGQAIGSLCVIDDSPRQWTAAELSLLEELAAVTGETVTMRTAAVERRSAALELSHRLRTGLTGLQLEAAEAVAGLAADDPAQAAVQRVVDGLQEQSAQLADALAVLERGGLGYEQEVDVEQLLEQVAAEATSSDRRAWVVTSSHVRTTTPAADLARAVREVVDLLFAHGCGEVQLHLLPGSSSVRVRVQGDRGGLPQDVVRSVTTRSDGGVDELSLAERVARQLRGRLLVAGATPTTIDLVLPVHAGR